MTIKDKVKKLVTEWDAKYERVPAADVAMLIHDSDKDFYCEFDSQFNKRKVGRFKVVTVLCPSYDNLSEKYDESTYDGLCDRFDAEVVELVGDCYWIIPVNDPLSQLSDPELAVVFSD